MSALLNNYDVLEILGTGSFGTCYKVQHVTTKDVFVWKAVDYSSLGQKSKDLLSSEVTLLSEICYPHIVRYYSKIVHHETSTLYIIMEWCSSGDVGKLLSKHRQCGLNIEDHVIWQVVSDIARALDWLHTHAIIHGNVKPSNIFLHSSGVYKLGDICLAARRNAVRSGLVQDDVTYRSPEELKGETANAKSDIWSLGCVAFEMSSLYAPFSCTTAKGILGSIYSERSLEDEASRFVPVSLARIIGWMLSIDNRPTASAVARHPSVVGNCSVNISSQSSIPAQSCASFEPPVRSDSNLAKETHRRPEEISYGLFKDKWVRRLEDVRGREAQADARERAVSERERRVASLERRVASLERRSRRSLSVPRSRRKPVIEDEPSYCGVAGDSSFSITTAARLDPSALPKPNFPPRVRFRSDSGIESGRESKLSDHEQDARKLQKLPKNKRPKIKPAPLHHSSPKGKSKSCKFVPPAPLQRANTTLALTIRKKENTLPHNLMNAGSVSSSTNNQELSDKCDKKKGSTFFSRRFSLYKRKKKDKHSNENPASDDHISKTISVEGIGAKSCDNISKVPKADVPQRDLKFPHDYIRKRQTLAFVPEVKKSVDQLDPKLFPGLRLQPKSSVAGTQSKIDSSRTNPINSQFVKNSVNSKSSFLKSSDYNLRQNKKKTVSKFVSLNELRDNQRVRKQSTSNSEPPTNRYSLYLEFSSNTDDDKCKGSAGSLPTENQGKLPATRSNLDDLSSNLFKVVNLR